MKCAHCGKVLKTHQRKYCSNRCQIDAQYEKYIREWRAGIKDGRRGKTSTNISKHIKRYLLEQTGERCAQCGWARKHPTTGNVPLEINHIDGNAENNTEHNLELICPNCHALTTTFRNLNKGKGRKGR